MTARGEDRALRRAFRFEAADLRANRAGILSRRQAALLLSAQTVRPQPEVQKAMAEALKDRSTITRLYAASYLLNRRQSTDDAVYNAAGGILRGDLGSDESYIGSEIDLLLNWQIDRHFSVYAGYSHFCAGSFIEDTGPSDDIDFFYLAGTFTF